MAGSLRPAIRICPSDPGFDQPGVALAPDGCPGSSPSSPATADIDKLIPLSSGSPAVPRMFRESRLRAAYGGIWLHTVDQGDLALGQVSGRMAWWRVAPPAGTEVSCLASLDVRRIGSA
jgi:hypothetical protein